MSEHDSGDAGNLLPEQQARLKIDELLRQADWVIQSRDDLSLAAGRGVAVRDKPGRDDVDYLLFVDGQAVGAVEAKKEGFPLVGVESQSARYADNLPEWVPAPIRPLPFLYESNSVEHQFTNGLDPEPRSREIFQFHQPETLAGWLEERNRYDQPTFRGRVRHLPALDDSALWPAQARAILKLEESLGQDRPRSLIQMATGSGKTYTAANEALRLVKFGGATRICFLVDRANLGRQTEGEFARFEIPGDGRKFPEVYGVQRLTSNRIDPTAKVVITTIQRLYSILRGEAELDEELDEENPEHALPNRPVEVAYNPDVPPEFFDVLIVDECHRSIYGLWSQVLDYFDAHIIGLTATPSKQTLGYFKRNLVFAYTHEEAVADKVNVDFDVYEIRTKITQGGSTIDRGSYVNVRDRATRRKRMEELDDDFVYGSEQLDRNVVAEDQIRTIIRHFRDVVCTDIFPGRSMVPKTLIFAKDDSHADDIVRIVREEFGRGNDFCVKITYKTTGAKPEDLLTAFRNSTMPRIAVTVDMIATGTDVKPLEIVFFMRSVKSRNFFEQMKGRGVRVIDDDTFQGVTPDPVSKERFVLIDAVGVTHEDMGESVPLERKRYVSLNKLFEQVALGDRDPDVVSSIASRLNNLDRRLTAADRAELVEAAGDTDMTDLVGNLVRAIDPDHALDKAVEEHGDDPTDEQVAAVRAKLIDDAVKPIASRPQLRKKILEIKASYDQVLDQISQDEVIDAGFSRDAADRARQLVTDWTAFIRDNRDELTALEILYDKPAGKRLTFDEIRELANAISRPPRRWTPDYIWEAYETLDKSKVRGRGGRVLTDIVSLVRYALEYDTELVPFSETVQQRFDGWTSAQAQAGRTFEPMQMQWLELIRDHIAGSLSINQQDLLEPPFTQHGGLARARRLFGDDLPSVLDELNEVLAA